MIHKVNGYIDRHMEPVIRDAMSHMRIVAALGPRQSGKTTLVKKIGDDLDMNYLSMDNKKTRKKAEEDPDGLIVPGKRYVIDEIQQVPDMIYAIKLSVDQDPTPGRFLITGSLHPFLSGISPDSLPGRLWRLDLLPFSQAELYKTKQPLAFLDHAFEDNLSNLPLAKNRDNNGIYEEILMGGYDMARQSSDSQERANHLSKYAYSLLEQELLNMKNVTQEAISLLPRLLTSMIRFQGQLVNIESLASELSTSAQNIRDLLRVFELMYLIRLVMPWHRKLGYRMTKASKLHFMDSGVIAALQKKKNAESLKKDSKALGALMEGFIFSELQKMCALTMYDIDIFHYRKNNKAEVDLVLEKDTGELVGVEVKASKKLKQDDFKGLRSLRETAEDHFVCGVILYLGEERYSPEPGLYALPYHSLWSSGEREEL